MSIKIKEIYGYNLSYDETGKRFVIGDTDGTELAWGKTQDEAEAKAKALSRQEFKRINIILVRGEGEVNLGELTSLNKDDKSAWISMIKGIGPDSGRRKIDLRYYRGYYEATEANLKTVESIKAKREALLRAQTEITALVGTLEKPINLEYFGMEA